MSLNIYFNTIVVSVKVPNSYDLYSENQTYKPMCNMCAVILHFSKKEEVANMMIRSSGVIQFGIDDQHGVTALGVMDMPIVWLLLLCVLC